MKEEEKQRFDEFITAFPLQGTTLLIGPMAAAKPLFGQILGRRWLEETGGTLLYLVTSAPLPSVKMNLRAFGIEEQSHVYFIDYVPGESAGRRDAHTWEGDLAQPETLRATVKTAIDTMPGPVMVAVPSITLLLANTEDRETLLATLNDLFYDGKTDFTVLAVNTKMFPQENTRLMKQADTVLDFRRQEDTVFLTVEQGMSKWEGKQVTFRVNQNILSATKKEVAKRTSRLFQLQKGRKTMMNLPIGVPEIDRHLPKGLPYPTLTVVTGPGASGKPLMAQYLLSAWLRSGKKSIYVATSTSPEFARTSMSILGVDLKPFEEQGQLGFVDFAKVPQIEEIAANAIRIDMSKPEMLRLGLETMAARLGTTLKEAMTVIPAANLFFMFPAAREQFMQTIFDLVKTGTWVLTINAEAFRKMAQKLQEKADNLIYTDMTAENQIRARIMRSPAPFDDADFLLPVNNEVLEAIKKEADSRRKQITQLR